MHTKCCTKGRRVIRFVLISECGFVSGALEHPFCIMSNLAQSSSGAPVELENPRRQAFVFEFEQGHVLAAVEWKADNMPWCHPATTFYGGCRVAFGQFRSLKVVPSGRRHRYIATEECPNGISTAQFLDVWCWYSCSIPLLS